MNAGAIRKLSGVLLAAVALALLTSCDGLISVRGRVYEQRRPGAQSRAFVDQTPDDDLSFLVPLEGAKVTVYHGGDYDQKPIDPSTSMKETGQTDASGGFSVGDVTAPTKFHAALVVEKPGYRTVTKIFQHEGLNHTAVVILVPDSPQ